MLGAGWSALHGTLHAAVEVSRNLLEQLLREGDAVLRRTAGNGLLVRWMDGWMDCWLDGWVDEWMDGWVSG